MSREKLTEALLEKSDEQARSIWQEVEQQASRYRQEAEERCNDRRRDAEVRHAARLAQQQDRLDNRVGKHLRRVRLQAEEVFSELLKQQALEQLSRLSSGDRGDCLQRLATELPEQIWQQVTVCPGDEPQAAKLFPGCHIATDAELLGGLVASTADDAVCVDNSLITRLEQIWPQLCGALLDTAQENGGADDAATAV